jgi:hypothetical protein
LIFDRKSASVPVSAAATVVRATRESATATSDVIHLLVARIWE